jgi:hypothetical protein
MKLRIPIVICLLAALPATALAADPHDRTYSPRAEQAPHYAQTQRYAPAQHYAQPQRYAPPTQRRQQAVYSQPRDVQQHYVVQQHNVVQQRYVQRDVQVMPRYVVRQPWVWNGGRVWVASSGYWAGGFWGPLAIGLSYNDYNNYNNYQVQPSSPGAELLQQYGLTQTDCDQPNLVDITGPDGGEICAYPNDEVSPGQYSVDPSTLTLVSD